MGREAKGTGSPVSSSIIFVMRGEGCCVGEDRLRPLGVVSWCWWVVWNEEGGIGEGRLGNEAGDVGVEGERHCCGHDS